MKNILMIGFGIVNSLEYKILNRNKDLSIDIYDKYKQEKSSVTEGEEKKYDFAYLTVPTDYKNKDNPCDISELKNALQTWKDRVEVFIVRSTVLPNLIDELLEITPNIVYMVELYGATHHANNFEQNFSILGGEKTLCIKVQQMLQHVYDARHSFKIVDIKTALLSKYMINSYLATKISFCVQFFEIAEEIGVDYETLRECFIMDDRINPAHTFVYRDDPYWDSHCFNKDVPAIAETFDAEFLKQMYSFNQKCKEKSSK